MTEAQAGGGVGRGAGRGPGGEDLGMRRGVSHAGRGVQGPSHSRKLHPARPPDRRHTPATPHASPSPSPTPAPQPPPCLNLSSSRSSLRSFFSCSATARSFSAAVLAPVLAKRPKRPSSSLALSSPGLWGWRGMGGIARFKTLGT